MNRASRAPSTIAQIGAIGIEHIKHHGFAPLVCSLVAPPLVCEADLDPLRRDMAEYPHSAVAAGKDSLP
jgi:hypothetical protein